MPDWFGTIDDFALGGAYRNAEDSLWEHAERTLTRYAGEDDAIVESIDPHARPELSLSEYTKRAWHTVYPTRPLQWNWHLDVINEHLEAVSLGQIKKLIVNEPPRTGKSTQVCVMWPTWEWTYAPWTTNLFFSYSQRFVKRDALRSRKLMASQWYQDRWGGLFQLRADQNEKLWYENTRGGVRMGSSIDGMGTGEGADRVVVDDPIKAKDAHSDTIRENVNEWWDEEGSSRVTSPVSSARVMIMQRTHEQDLAGHEIAKDAGWEVLVLPMHYRRRVAVNGVELTNGGSKRTTSLGAYDKRTKPGELLWPDRFPDHVVKDWEKELKPYAASAQLEQEPTPAGGGIFKDSWWRFWIPPKSELGPVTKMLKDKNEVHVYPVMVLPRNDWLTFQSWDLNFDSSESMVSGHVYMCVGANVFMGADERRGAWDFAETIRQFKDLSRQFPAARLKVVEDAANARALLSTLRTQVPGIVLQAPRGDKQTRARAFTSIPESGNFYLPHPAIAPWVWEWIQEFSAFRGDGDDEFADRVDDWSQAMKRIEIEKKRRRMESGSHSFSSYGA